MMPNQDAAPAAQPDILVIGAGVVGICSAYYLAGQGQRVTVVDKGEVGAGCSYGNAGLLVPSHSVPLAAPGVFRKALKWIGNPESPLYIKPRLSLSLLSWMWRFQMACREKPMRKSIPILRDLSLASLALHQELAGKSGMDWCYAEKGLLMVYHSSQGLKDGGHEASLLAEYGIKSRILAAQEVRELAPEVRPEIVGGVFYPDNAHLQPHQFVQSVARLAKEKGVEIRTGTEVVGFETAGGKIRTVRTTRGDFHPGQVVLATGSWSPGLTRDFNLDVCIQPAKGYSVTVRRPARWSSPPLMLCEAKVGVTPMGDLLRFAGTLELAGLDFSINSRRVSAIQRAAREYLVGAEEAELVEIWRGLRPCTPDALPIIARSKSPENLIVAAGHGMLGVSLGPITGKLVSQLATLETPMIDLSLLSAERFQ